jgi:serine/threonine protein kinase
MHGLAQDERYLYIFLDYIAGGELFNYLRSIGNLNNDEAKYYHIFYFIYKKKGSMELKLHQCSNTFTQKTLSIGKIFFIHWTTLWLQIWDPIMAQWKILWAPPDNSWDGAL